MRRAKIVCTLGPATDSYVQILELTRAGMDVARFNLSHGGYAEHERRYHDVRRAADETGRGVGVLVDLQGPKIRLGRFAAGPVLLVAGAEFTITTRDVPGDVLEASTTYAGLPGDVSVGDRILVDDGKVALEATAVTEDSVTTRVVEGGLVSDNKGLNLPGVAVSVPALSEKDMDDLRWGLRVGADMIALSFVRNAKDAADVHAIMQEEGRRVPLLAKIEKPQAVDHLEEIVDAFDGIMVARGDLGVEMPLEAVPLVQKRAIELARQFAKPVIVATQILESMITASRPTRAEASDVANAVLDGTDALMLSGETSVGAYAFSAVRTMARIIEATEEQALDRVQPMRTRPHTMGGAITWAAHEVGELLNCKYLITFTHSGDSARRISRLRTNIPVLAFTPIPATRSQLSLSWGIETFIVDMVEHTDEMVMQVDRSLLATGHCNVGELVVIVAGAPPGIPGSTNALRVHKMGDAVAGVAPAYRRF